MGRGGLLYTWGLLQKHLHGLLRLFAPACLLCPTTQTRASCSPEPCTLGRGTSSHGGKASRRSPRRGGQTNCLPDRLLPSEGAARPAPSKGFAIHDAKRQGIEVPSICEDSGSRTTSEQLHLLPFRRATATLPTPGTALLDGNTAEGCRPPAPLPRRHAQPGTIPSLQPRHDGAWGETPLLPRGKQRWDGWPHVRLPPALCHRRQR